MKKQNYFWLSLLGMSLIFSLSGCSSKSETAKEPVVPSQSAAAPARGDEKAPLQIEQFSDFYCPYCKEQAHVFKKLMMDYPEKIRVTFRHFPLSEDPTAGSFPIHEASVCAAEQNKFWEFHDFVFLSDHHPQVDEIVAAVNLDSSKMEECLKSGRAKKVVLNDVEDAETRKISGVPVFFIGGEKIMGIREFGFFAEKIDPAFAAKAEAERKQAREDMMKKIDFTAAGRPSQGSESAPVTLVEFSDFHCYFCKQLTPALNELMVAYPDKVRRVWRHFPLPMHPGAPFAHLAAECAHEQSKFWEFHDKIFLNPENAKSKEDFLRIAGEVGVDLEKFDACYENPLTKKKIENDILLGDFKGIASTPSVLINDELFVGAKSLEELKALVDKKLSEQG